MTTIDSSRVAVTQSSTASREAELLARIRQSDERACEELVREHGPRMLAVAARFFRSPDDRDDAVQDAFISAFRSIDSFGGTSSLGTWLHRIAVNACLMKLRRRRDEVSIDTLLPKFAADGHHAAPVRAWEDDGFTRASEAETRQIVRSCIDQLPGPYREVLLLRDIEELDTQQTAALLGCTSANVKTRLHRARQALRTLIEQHHSLTD